MSMDMRRGSLGIRGVVAALGAVVAVAGTARAAVEYRSVAQISVEAARIVVGDITSVEPFTDNATTLTWSNIGIAVTDYLKGAGPAALTLTQWGGTIDGTTLFTTVTPTFLVGDHVLLFLRADGTLAGAYQGAYLTDGILAVQMQPGHQRYEQGDADLLEDLLAQIAAALPGEGVPGSVNPYRGAFTLRGDGGVAWVPIGCSWDYQSAPMGESYLVNANCSDSGCGSLTTVHDAINRGGDVWVNAGAGFYFNELSTTGSVLVAFNNQNVMYFQQVGGINPPTIAATFYWCSGSNMTEWDMAYNDFHYQFWDGVTGSCGGTRMDIQAIAAHELGHTLGLAHSPIQAATMFASTGACNTLPRTLHSDDIAGVNGLYGAAAVSLPFFEDFPDTSIDPVKWIGIDGAAANDVGLNEPSPPDSLDLDGATDGGNTLVSAFLNLAGLSGLSLTYAFERTGGGETPSTGNDLIIDYSNTAGLWTELDRQLGNDTNMGDYEQVAVPLPPAAYHATFHVRIRTTSFVSGSDDWFVDDVCIGGPADCVLPAPCPWDCQATADGNVGISDLLALLAQWGLPTPCDFDGGGVGINDLLAMLSVWGACP